MAEKKPCPGYAGKIGNGGSQSVEAVFNSEKPKAGKVKEGNDLRTK